MCRIKMKSTAFKKKKTLLQYFTTGLNVTKLSILSTAKHLKYRMKYTDFRRGT